MHSLKSDHRNSSRGMSDSWISKDADVRHGRLMGTRGGDADRRVLTIVGERSFTARELWAAVEERERMHEEVGLRRGDRLCLMLDNGSEFVLDLLAAFRSGVVVAPLNTALRGQSLSSVVRDLSPCVMRTSAAHLEAARSAVEEIDGVSLWPVAGELEPGFVRLPDDPAPSGPMGEHELAVILLTSGTTGLPKGVMWPYGMALAVAEHTTWVMGYDDQDTIYTCLPLFHINALFCALYAGLVVGAHVVISPRFSISSYWREIVDHGATTTNMMGAIPALLWRKDACAEERAHRLRLGMVLPLPVERTEFEARFGFPITEVYGSTDAGIPLGIPFGTSRPGACGVPTPGWEADVVDALDHTVPTGVEGELVTRPRRPHIGSLGYWRQPQATVDATQNLWFHTGDVVVRDAEGWFSYRGRGKEMLRVSGENIAPIQVEATLLRHAAVDEVCVYGLPSELGEDSVVAAVVPRPGTLLDLDELRALAESHLPYFAVPRYFWVVEALPKTATSKVLKSELVGQGLTAGHWDGGQPRRPSG